MKTIGNIIYPAFAAIALAWVAVSPIAQAVISKAMDLNANSRAIDLNSIGVVR